MIPRQQLQGSRSALAWKDRETAGTFCLRMAVDASLAKTFGSKSNESDDQNPEPETT